MNFSFIFNLIKCFFSCSSFQKNRPTFSRKNQRKSKSKISHLWFDEIEDEKHAVYVTRYCSSSSAPATFLNSHFDILSIFENFIPSPLILVVVPLAVYDIWISSKTHTTQINSQHQIERKSVLISKVVLCCLIVML